MSVLPLKKPTNTSDIMKVLDTTAIKKLIPHRYPMLLIDRVMITSQAEGVGIKAVTANEPFFQGHFPDKPIMPGVLIVEAMAQTAGVIVMAGMQEQTPQKLVYFMSIEEAKFRKPVVPGDVLEMKIEKIQSRVNVWKFAGKAMVQGQVHAEGTFTAMIVSQEG